MRTVIFVALFRRLLRKIKENCGFGLYFFKNRPWIFRYGFLLWLYFNFSLFGPGRGPPHKGGRKVYFFEEFAIRVKLLHKYFPFLAFSGPSWTGRRASLKIKAKHRKAQPGIPKPSIANHSKANPGMARHSKAKQSRAQPSKAKS